MKYLADLQKFFHEHKNDVNPGPMKKYMKDKFDFLGIKSPERKQLLKEFALENGYPERKDLENVAVGLYSLPYREFHYIAMELADRLTKKSIPEDIYAIEYLLEYNQWWDTVDFIASNIVGRWVKQNPSVKHKYISKWINSSDMWLNRTAILYQLKYRNDTNTEILTEAIQKHAASHEFFHKKAIGWALREYAKTDPDWVRSFIQINDLSNLSKREALKNL